MVIIEHFHELLNSEALAQFGVEYLALRPDQKQSLLSQANKVIETETERISQEQHGERLSAIAKNRILFEVGYNLFGKNEKYSKTIETSCQSESEILTEILFNLSNTVIPSGDVTLDIGKSQIKRDLTEKSLSGENVKVRYQGYHTIRVTDDESKKVVVFRSQSPDASSNELATKKILFNAGYMAGDYTLEHIGLTDAEFPLLIKSTRSSGLVLPGKAGSFGKAISTDFRNRD